MGEDTGQKSASKPGHSVDGGAAVIVESPRAPEPPAEQLENTEVRESDEEMTDVH